MDPMDIIRRRYLRRRPWFQYRLHTLLLLTALTAAGLGVWTGYWSPVQRQIEATRWLTQVRPEIGGRPFDPRDGPPVLDEVTWLELDVSNLENDDDLRHLREMPRLHHLSLADTNVSDKGLAHVGKLTHLSNLSLAGTKITDEGAAHLGGMRQLRVLDVTGTNLTSACLEHIGKLHELRVLSFSFPVDDKAITHLTGLPELSIGELHCVGVSDEGLRQLKRIKGCHSLVIEGACQGQRRVTDAGVAHLADVYGLRSLHIQSDRFTGEALSRLVNWSGIRYLCIDAPGVKHATVRKHYGRFFQRVVVCKELVSYIAENRRVDVLGPMSATDIEALGELPRLRSVAIFGRSVRCPAVLDAAGLWWWPRRPLSSGSPTTKRDGYLRWHYLAMRQRCEPFATGYVDLSPQALRSLQNCRRLEELRLVSVGLTDDQLGFLEGLPGLKSLDLSGNNLRGDGLKHVAGLRHLRGLCLNGCSRLDDRALAEIGKLGRCVMLQVHDTAVTRDGLARMRAQQNSGRAGP